ncbi:hypothetical protein JTB14_022131 [Gonioctena quinquepunctata]|nr:hypothetical protein JTB14_022131 [Gonioctena quinquepunctata]
MKISVSCVGLRAARNPVSTSVGCCMIRMHLKSLNFEVKSHTSSDLRDVRRILVWSSALQRIAKHSKQIRSWNSLGQWMRGGSHRNQPENRSERLVCSLRLVSIEHEVCPTNIVGQTYWLIDTGPKEHTSVPSDFLGGFEFMVFPKSTVLGYLDTPKDLFASTRLSFVPLEILSRHVFVFPAAEGFFFPLLVQVQAGRYSEMQEPEGIALVACDASGDNARKFDIG